MLPRHNRLPAGGVRQIMRYGKRVIGNGMTIIVISRQIGFRKANSRNLPKNSANDSGNQYHSGSQHARFSFIVSVKVSKSAVIRNRIRRLLRESVHHMIPNIPDTVDMVVIGTKEIVGMTQVEVQRRMSDLLSKAHFLNHE